MIDLLNKFWVKEDIYEMIDLHNSDYKKLERKWEKFWVEVRWNSSNYQKY